MKGYVYIISNKAMPGIFKIGYTMYDPAIRAKELEGTGVPHPFVVEYEILVDDPMKLEQSVHRFLSDVNENKEWFRCDFSQCVSAIHKCLDGCIYYERFFMREREEAYAKEQERIRAEEEQKANEKRRIQLENEKRIIDEQKKNETDKELQYFIMDKRRKSWINFLVLSIIGSIFLSALLDKFTNILGIFLTVVLATGWLVPIIVGYHEEDWRKEFFANRK